MTGSQNTASGADALFNNTTGDQSTASGFEALVYNTTGQENTAFGAGALFYNTTGGANTAVGGGAGTTTDVSRLTGSQNTAIGAFTTLGTGSLTNATAIGASAEVDASNSLVLGSINGVNFANADTNVGIGITAPVARLHIGLGNSTGLRIEGPNTTGTGVADVSLARWLWRFQHRRLRHRWRALQG